MQKFFILFLICSGILWTIVPSVYHSTLHFDPAETLMWGSTFNLGNAKHPPMSGYMLFNFCKLFGFQNFAIFLLSQICVTIGFIYIYKLGRCFFDKDKSVIATLLITFYFFYNYETPKFNANIPHLLFMPMMTYYFYRGCVANKWHHWLLAAAAAACACLSKYTAGIVGITFCLFLIVNKDARKVLLTVKPYIAALFFIGLMTPHILHLINTDFVVFEYINHGKKEKYSYLIKLLVQCIAIIVPLICMSTALLITHLLGKRKISCFKLTVANHKAFQYSLCIMGGQALFLLLTGILGHRLLTIWTFPIYLTAGIFIMSLYPVSLDERSKRCFIVLCSVFAAIMLLFPLIYYNCKSKYRYHMDKNEMRTVAENFYRTKTGKDVPFITGDIWSAAMLQNTFKYTIKAAPSFDPILMGLHSDTISRNGALVITTAPKTEAANIKKMFNIELEWEKHEITYAARFGKQKTFKFYLAVIPPGIQMKTERKK